MLFVQLHNTMRKKNRKSLWEMRLRERESSILATEPQQQASVSSCSCEMTGLLVLCVGLGGPWCKADSRTWLWCQLTRASLIKSAVVLSDPILIHTSIDHHKFPSFCFPWNLHSLQSCSRGVACTSYRKKRGKIKLWLDVSTTAVVSYSQPNFGLRFARHKSCTQWPSSFTV